MFPEELLKRTQKILIIMGILTMLRKNDPQYEIKSDKTDHVAAHKAKTLKKLNKPLTFCKKFMEIGNRFYSSVVIFNIIFFIWGMEIVAVQAKAHKNNFYSQLLFKNRANRNAS